jgi:probable rRNA maturation factor
MPVDLINLQRKFSIDPILLTRITELGLESLKRSRDSIALIFINDKRMRNLNKTFRGKTRTTDVLSFSYKKEKSLKGLGTPDGEIVISLQQAQKQATIAGISLFDEIVNLIIHGLCHLKGYDHELGDKEALIMKNAERKTANFIQKGYDQRYKTGSEDHALQPTENRTPVFQGKISDDLPKHSKQGVKPFKRKEMRS